MSQNPEVMPNAEKIEFKQNFIDRYSQLTDWEQFKFYSLSFLRRSIRINTATGDLKQTKEDIEAKGWILKPIPWCKEGFWIEHPDRRDVGNLF